MKATVARLQAAGARIATADASEAALLGNVTDVAAWNRRATRNTRPGNLFGQCGISLPIQYLGADPSAKASLTALPFGLHLCASPGQNMALLSVACTIGDLLGRPAASVLDVLTG